MKKTNPTGFLSRYYIKKSRNLQDRAGTATKINAPQMSVCVSNLHIISGLKDGWISMNDQLNDLADSLGGVENAKAMFSGPWVYIL